ELAHPADPAHVRPPRALPTGIMMSGGTAPEIRSGHTRGFRRCAEHGAPMELVFVRLIDDASAAPLLLAWWCEACRRCWTEQYFRHLRRHFIPDATPGAQCPSCSSEALEAAGDDGSASCSDCGARMHVWLAATARKEPTSL